MANLLQLALATFGVGLVIYVAGWPDEGRAHEFALELVRWVAVAYGAAFAAEALSAEGRLRFAREHWLASCLALLVVASAVLENWLSQWLRGSVGMLSVRNWLIVIVAAQQFLALATRVGEAVPWIERNLFTRMSPGALLVSTFALLSLGGALLLKMPNATTDGIGFLDALFTSTSAVCVTGLIVVDTATAFTPLGQLIILGLIQLGGLGIVTLTFFVAIVGGPGVAVSSRVVIRDLINTENLGRLGSALTFIFVVTFAFEAVGAYLIRASWQASGLEGNLWWVAVFHSVSSFCNAGFSVFSDGLAHEPIAANRMGQLVVMGLILLGGIGFPVLREVWQWLAERVESMARGPIPRARKRIGVHARLAAAASAVLLLGGLIWFWAAERYVGEGSWEEAFWLAAFRTVSARTAGFNIADIGAMSHAGAAGLMLLMFVGGSPGGMAGGIKTTTFSVALLNLKRILWRRRDVTIFGRRVEESVCQRAFAVVLLSMLWILGASGTIMLAQPDLNFLDTLFETVSAFATVGLSRGVTGELDPLGKSVMVATMLVGRVGMLNFFLSLLPARPDPRITLPSGSVIVE